MGIEVDKLVTEVTQEFLTLPGDTYINSEGLLGTHTVASVAEGRVRAMEWGRLVPVLAEILEEGLGEDDEHFCIYVNEPEGPREAARSLVTRVVERVAIDGDPNIFIEDEKRKDNLMNAEEERDDF